MKKKYLFIGILIIAVLQAHAQKPDEPTSTKSEEYEIEADYDPTMKSPPNKTATPMIIGLASFKGEYFKGENFVRLSWGISKKLGIFVVEHSIDGKLYREIGSVENPIGFEDAHYTFEAREFEAGINFYRLRQDIGGDVIYSEMKAITVSKKDGILIFEITDKGDSKRIELRSREIQNVSIQFLDAEGNLKKELFNQGMTVNEIIFRDIKKEDFPSGEYFILVKGQNFKQSKKIVLP